MSKNNLLYLTIGFLILIGLFYLLKPKPVPAPANSVTPLPQISNVKAFDLVINNKKLINGPDIIKVTEGDQVIINITADENEELHLHGYDKSIDLEASKAAQLKFTANLTGRFTYELEKSKEEIGALEVQPK